MRELSAATLVYLTINREDFKELLVTGKEITKLGSGVTLKLDLSPELRDFIIHLYRKAASKAAS